jgi:hypothetical protein
MAAAVAGCAATNTTSSSPTEPTSNGDPRTSLSLYAKRVVEWRTPNKSGANEPDWLAEPPDWAKLVSAYRAIQPRPDLPAGAAEAFARLGADARQHDVKSSAADCKRVLAEAPWSPEASFNCALVDAVHAHYPRARWLMKHFLDLAPEGVSQRAVAEQKLRAWDGVVDGGSFYGEAEPCQITGEACK